MGNLSVPERTDRGSEPMNPQRLIAAVILLTGTLMLVAGLVAIAVADPLIGAVLLIVGASDLLVGRLLRSRRIGATGPASAGGAEAGAALYGSTADGTAIKGEVNPYARED